MTTVLYSRPRLCPKLLGQWDHCTDHLAATDPGDIVRRRRCGRENEHRHVEPAPAPAPPAWSAPDAPSSTRALPVLGAGSGISSSLPPSTTCLARKYTLLSGRASSRREDAGVCERCLIQVCLVSRVSTRASVSRTLDSCVPIARSRHHLLLDRWRRAGSAETVCRAPCHRCRDRLAVRRWASGFKSDQEWEYVDGYGRSSVR